VWGGVLREAGRKAEEEENAEFAEGDEARNAEEGRRRGSRRGPEDRRKAGEEEERGWAG
jgi:hypothetical protein